MSTGSHVEARQRFLSFALDPNNPWSGNFRDLNAMVIRMATLADGGRITLADVNDEIGRNREGGSEMKNLELSLVVNRLGATGRCAQRRDGTRRRNGGCAATRSAPPQTDARRRPGPTPRRVPSATFRRIEDRACQ